MSLRHEPDVSEAAWFATLDEPWTQLSCLGPSGFERYARLFHPLPESADVTDAQALADLEGDLPDPELLRLVDVLARHTSTADDCFFALWEGYGDIHGGTAVSVLTQAPRGLFGRLLRRRNAWAVPPAFPPDVLGAPRVSIPNRSFLLFAGPLTEAGQWGAAEVMPGWPRRINSPNLMWPADHAWFVATEIDQPWTGIGGSAALLTDLLSDDRLDVQPTELSEHPPYWRA